MCSEQGRIDRSTLDPAAIGNSREIVLVGIGNELHIPFDMPKVRAGDHDH